jgi:hypothetical protein
VGIQGQQPGEKKEEDEEEETSENFPEEGRTEQWGECWLELELGMGRWK